MEGYATRPAGMPELDLLAELSTRSWRPPCSALPHGKLLTTTCVCCACGQGRAGWQGRLAGQAGKLLLPTDTRAVVASWITCVPVRLPGWAYSTGWNSHASEPDGQRRHQGIPAGTGTQHPADRL